MANLSASERAFRDERAMRWFAPFGALYFACSVVGLGTSVTKAWAALFAVTLLPMLALVRLWEACVRHREPSDQLCAAAAGPALAVVVLTACRSCVPDDVSIERGVLLLLAFAGMLPVLVVRRDRAPASASPLAPVGAGLAFAALVAVPFVAYGLERGDGIHRMGMTDWYKHLVVTSALRSSPTFPPANPFLATAGAAPYYYGFHLLAATVLRVSNAESSAFPVLFALTLLTAALVPLVLHAVARGLGCSSRTAFGAALAGTFLGGFDVVPQILRSIADVAHAWPLPRGFAALRAIVPSTHVDSWIHHDERQFNVPYVATIWAPQHVLGALLALLALYLLRARDDDAALESRGERRLRAGFAAILLGALPAISAYVAVGLAVGVAGAALAETFLLRRAPWRTATFRSWGPAALVAVPLALPALAAMHGAGGGGLTVHVSAAGDWRNGAFFTALLGDGALPRLLDTPMVLLVEFGVVGALAASEVARVARRRDDASDASHVARVQALGVIVATVLLTTFVRPPEGGPNNLYARPLLVVWGLLAPFAALAFERLGGSRRARRWIVVAALPCAAYLPYAIVGPTLEGALFWAAPRELVEIARTANQRTTPDTVVAIEPAVLDSSFGYWLDRRVVIGDRRHALLFGGTAAGYDETARAVAASAALVRAGNPCGVPDVTAKPHAFIIAASSATPAADMASAPWPGAAGSVEPFTRVAANARYALYANASAAFRLPRDGAK